MTTSTDTERNDAPPRAETPPLPVGAKVRLRVERQRCDGVDFAGGWYVGTVEEVRTNPMADVLPYVWRRCCSVRTRKGGALFTHCAMSAVVAVGGAR